jgi:hypothetical protein
MGGSHNSEGVITEEGGVFTENYSERRVTGPAVIVTVREEIVVYEAVLHEEKVRGATGVSCLGFESFTRFSNTTCCTRQY